MIDRHCCGKLTQLKLPEAGATLRLVDTIAVPFTGQGVAFDRNQPDILYGIDRPKSQVVVDRIGGKVE